MRNEVRILKTSTARGHHDREKERRIGLGRNPVTPRGEAIAEHTL